MRNWEKNIRRVVPYTPGDQPEGDKLIKLNTNENPYPPAPGVRTLLEQMKSEPLRKYPDPTASVLTEALADVLGVRKEQVFPGVGSDDVLAMAFLTFFNSEELVLFPDITYSFYQVWAGLFRIPFKTIPLKEDFTLNLADYRCANGGIIFPNPNAPTGLYLPLEEIEELLKANQESVVIVDEAYVDFAGPSAVSLIDRYENLLVVQTFSKSRSMAGLRVGFAVGNERLIQALNDVKYSYNSYTMNLPSQILGAEVLKDPEYFQEMVGKIIKTRERSKVQLRELGFTFPDSQANFIFATHPAVPAKELYEALKREQIYVRYFNTPGLDQYLRITIGTDQEMDELFDFLKRYLQSRPVK